MIDYFLRPSTFYDMPFVCSDATINVSTHWKHAKGMSLRYDVFVNSVDYRKNAERNAAKIPNEMPQKYRMDYHDVLETDMVLLLIKFERLMGGG